MVNTEIEKIGSSVWAFTMVFVFLFVVFWSIFNRNLGENDENSRIYERCLEIHAALPHSEAKSRCMELVDRASD